MNRVIQACLVAFFACGLCPLHAQATSQPDELVPGVIVIVKAANVAKFVAKPSASSTFGLPDSSNDPVTQGGTLHIFDTVVRAGGDVTFTLTPGTAKWKALGNPPGAKGFKYTGAGTTGDPCKVVLIKPTVVKAVCKGTDVALTLPFQGDLAVVLSVGTDAKRYCAGFGGTAKGAPAKIFKRTGAAPPAMCPSSAVATETPTATALPTPPSTPPPTPMVEPTAVCFGSGNWTGYWTWDPIAGIWYWTWVWVEDCSSL